MVSFLQHDDTAICGNGDKLTYVDNA